MAEYGYEDLQKRIFDELKTAITESGEKAITSGLSELMKKKLTISGINIDTKELTTFLEQQINIAMAKVKPKKIKNFDYSLIGADKKTIQKALRETYSAYMNAETDKQIETAAKNFISTIEIAKKQAVKIGEDLLEEYNYLFSKNSTLSDSLSKSLNTFKQRAVKELSSINLKKILDESIGDYSKTKTKAKQVKAKTEKPKTQQSIKKDDIIPDGVSEELDDYKRQLRDIAENYEALSQLSKNSPMLKGIKETIEEITEDYPELQRFFDLLKSGLSLDDVFSSQQWKDFSSEILEEEKAFSKSVDQIYDEQDALDENLQKQKQLTEEKKKTAEAQEEINKNNLSSGIETPAEKLEQYQKVSESTVNVLSDIGKSEDEIISKLEQERLEAEKNNEVWKEHLVLLDEAGKVVANHLGNETTVTGFTPEQIASAQGGKVIHTHPGESSFFGGSDLRHLLEESLYSQIKEIELRYSDSILKVDTSTMTKESSSVLLNIMQNVRKKLTEMYGDNPGGMPSVEAREHINAIEKEIFKSVADKLGVVAKESGSTSQDVVSALSDTDKQIIQHFKDLAPTALNSIDFGKLISNETPVLFEEESGQLSYIEGLDKIELKEKEVREQIEDTNEIIKGQLSLFDLKTQEKSSSNENVENIQKELDITSELYDKLVKIQDLTDDFSIFEPEDIDESSLKEFQQTLFALSETDLKNLGIDDVGSLIEDLKTVEERISEIRWQFENNTYDDESFVENDQLFDFIEKTGELEEVGRQITDTYDESGIAVQRLIDLISGIDTSKYRDELEEALKEQEQITEEKNKTTKAQEQINKKDEEGNDKKTQSINLMEEAVKKKQQEKENTESTVKAKEEETVAENKITEEKKENLDITNNIAVAEKEAGKTQLTAYKQALITLKELTEQQEYYRKLIEKTPPQYAIEKYDNRRNAYSKLSDEDLNSKLIEKASEPLESDTGKLTRQISSILALIDELKARGQEIKFEDIVPKVDDIKVTDKIDKMVDSLRKYFDLLNDNSGKDYKSEWQSEIQAVSQQRDALERQLKSLADQDPLDKLEYHLKELINGDTTLRINEVYGQIIKTMNEIYKITGQQPDISAYTDKTRIINGVNNELKRMALLEDEAYQAARRAEFEEKQRAKASKETANAVQEETIAVKQETNVIEQNTEVQQTNMSAKAVSNVATLPNSIKVGLKDEDEVVNNTVSSEIISLDRLKNTIFEVRDAIDSKTLAFSEELSTVERVVGDERNSLNLLRDKLAEIKGYTEELYSQIGNIGKIDFSGKIKVDGLSTLLSSLKDDKLNTKLTAIYTYLDDFAKAVNSISFKNDFTEQLNTILSKGEELKNLANILKKVNKNSIKNVKESVDSENIKTLKQYNDAYQILINSEKKYQELKNKEQISSLTEKEVERLTELEYDRKEALQTINQIIEQTSSEIKKQSNAEEKYNSVAQKTLAVIKARNEAREKVAATNNRNSLESSLQKEIEAIEKMASMSHKYTGDFRNYLADEINSASLAFKGTDEEIEQMILHLKEVRENVPTDAFESTFLTLDKYGLRIQNFLAKNTAMSEEFKIKLQEIYNTIQRYKDVGGDIDLKSILSDIVKIEDKVTSLGQTGKSTADKLKQQLQHIWRQDFARYFGLYDIIRYIRQISDEVIKVDTALTELRKVSDATNERLQQSFQKSSDTAKELGSTISDVINVTADWARLKY